MMNMNVETRHNRDDGFIIIVVLSIFVVIIRINNFYGSFLQINSFQFNDVLFPIDITYQDEYQTNTQLMIPILFIVFSALISVYKLHKAINKWRWNEELTVWIGDNVLR